jgi:ubiquinol-cytochrome c reductase iron-sulfur subunit
MAVTVAVGGSTPLAGALGGAGLGAMAAALVGVARRVAPADLDEEEREPSFTGLGPGRRRLLIRALLGAAALGGLASLFPLRAETRRAGRAVGETAWRPGSRLVTDDGRPVRAGDLDVGSVLTVWPEGRTDAADSQVVLVRLEPGTALGGTGRTDWVADGHVAYSKLCTHMGCPVGLYQQQRRVLLCPCHQAAFDVVQGAQPLIGPASRPLPQLPLEVDGEGYLRATGGFPGPVGSGYWSRPA